jgi:hypothetical protein
MGKMKGVCWTAAWCQVPGLPRGLTGRVRMRECGRRRHTDGWMDGWMDGSGAGCQAPQPAGTMPHAQHGQASDPFHALRWVGLGGGEDGLRLGGIP